MKLAVSILGLIMALVLLNACFKEEARVEPHPRGDVVTDTIPMTDLYLFQIYYDLEAGMIIRQNVKTGIDLGFECSQDGFHVVLNSANFMKIADLGVTAFGQAYDTAGKAMKFDKSDGNPDSTAIGRWFIIVQGDTLSNQHVYAVSRGLDENGNPLGLYQLIIDSLKNGIYYFRHAALAGGETVHATVKKNAIYRYTWYSLESKEVIAAEPAADQWDLLFTQYTTMLYTDAGYPYPYLLTGVLINQPVSVSRNTQIPFQEVAIDQTYSLLFSSHRDIIGYDWKDYNFNQGNYTIVPGLNYIIRSRSGYLFKLRFIGFYNKHGSKGYPVIEYQRL